jgi:hypothetical protein
MKGTSRFALTIVVAFAVIAFVVAGGGPMLFSGDRALAAEGCCMQRQCPDDTCQWYVMPGDYESCKKINDQRDRDDVESESGLIWWSEDC